MSEIIIVGREGFLGSHISKYFEKNGNIVHHIRNIEWFDLFTNKKIDYIFHCALMKNFNSYNGMICNDILNSNIIWYWHELYEKFGTKLVTFGSDAAYDPIYLRREQDYLDGYCNENWKYVGESKRNLLRKLNLSNSKNWYHFVLTSLYGTNFTRNDEHLIHSLVKKILNFKYKQEPIELQGNLGLCKETIYVNDLINNINAVLNTDFSGLLNMGSVNKKMNIEQYLHTICELANVDISNIKSSNYHNNDFINKFMNNNKAIELLGQDYKDTLFENSVLGVMEYYKNEILGIKD